MHDLHPIEPIYSMCYELPGSNAYANQITTQDALRQMGEWHGKTAGQILLRWAVQQNVSVIPGTSNPKHQKVPL